MFHACEDGTGFRHSVGAVLTVVYVCECESLVRSVINLISFIQVKEM